MNKKLWAALLALPLAACGPSADESPVTQESGAKPEPTPTVAPDRDLEAWLRTEFAEWMPASYRSSEFDLDGDGSPETLVYVASPMICGTGGCSLLVLKHDGSSYRVVTQTSVTRLPVGVRNESTNGWVDLFVTIAGGGMENERRILKFDGTSYPTNPTVPPATVVKDLDGQVLIEDVDLIPLAESGEGGLEQPTGE